MQISENLLRVIFMLSTIVAVTDCCSSRLLLLKEHTLQIVQHRVHNINIGDNADYDYDDYAQLQQQQQQQQLEQQQQQQKMPQYVDITNSDIEFNKNSTDEHTRSRDDNEENSSTDANILVGAMKMRDFGMGSFDSLLGIFDAAAFETTTNAETTPEMRATIAESGTTTTTAKTVATATIMETTAAQATLTAPAATTTTASTTTATAEISTTLPTAESSSQKPNTVASKELNAASNTTTTKMPATSTIISDMENVMNDLKTAGDLLSLPCSGQFNTEFCLNRGRCFRYPIGNDTIHSCICADGYIGERCESKSMNGSFIPSIAGTHKKKIAMARIVFSFPMLVALTIIYVMIGAAIVFKRPIASTERETTRAPTSPAILSASETYELFGEEDTVGEFIALNSYPIAPA